MKPDAKVTSIAAEINKRYGGGTVILASDIKNEFAPRVTSGALSLDVALGGGWPTNKWIEIVGEYSTGKTALALKTIAANQEIDPKYIAVWIAAESFHDGYAEMLGVDLDRVVIIDTNIMEEAFSHVLAYLESHAVDAVVIDSLPALVPDPESNGGMDDWHPGLAARITNKFFRKAHKAIKRSTIAAQRPVLPIVINQYREMIGVSYGDNRTTPGGKQKDYEYFVRVDVRRGAWILDDHKRNRTARRGKKKAADKPMAVGQEMLMRVWKNKTSPGQRIAELDFYFDDAEVDGIKHRAGSYDLVRDAVLSGRTFNIITHRGGGYYVISGWTEEPAEWRGLPVLEQALREEPALLEHVTSSVLDIVLRREKPPEIPAQVDDDDEDRPRRRRPRKKRT